MPSRFPGMDPYIEGADWQDFHSGFIAAAKEALVARLRPRYVVRTEETIYVTNEDDAVLGLRYPDLTLSPGEEFSAAPTTAASATLAPSVTLPLPLPRRFRQLSLQILHNEDRRLVTIVELLSPWNKSGDGRAQYLKKRGEILAGLVNLVELDLLRGGVRLPVRGRLPPAVFCAFVCRRSERPVAEVFPWTLRQPLPTIPIPLAPDDDEARLELQPLFDATYDRAGYDYSLNYRTEIVPPLNDADQTWAARLLTSGPVS